MFLKEIMGNYITKTDILSQLQESYLIQLTDDANAGVVDDAKVNAAISHAEGEVDGYLSVRYDTPVSPVPQAVVAFVVDIAIYRLYARRTGAPDDVLQRYKDAVAFFDRCSRGVVSLGVKTIIPDNSGGSVDIKSNPRVFTRDSMGGY